jgi:formylglycine-generating enzyme required for sulfatase activity
MRSILLFITNVVFIVSAFGCSSSRRISDEADSASDRTEDAETDRDADTFDAENGIIDAPCAPNCPDLEWVAIPAGTFQMGSPEGIGTDDERPQHEVTIHGYQILKTEVTVSQYRKCVDAVICSEPNHVVAPMFNWDVPGRENHPVNGVTWYQATEFAEWVGARLPSEAEWEYAARSGGEDIVYPWGNEEATCDYAVIDDGVNGKGCGAESAMEVCSKPLGNTAQGLCDMAGNIREWVEDDWHDIYNGAPSDGRAWIDSPREERRVSRGGSWYYLPRSCRAADRGSKEADAFSGDYGFRLVINP